MADFLERWWPTVAGVVLLVVAALLLWPSSPEQIGPERTATISPVSQTPQQGAGDDARGAELERQKALEDARQRAELRAAESQRGETAPGATPAELEPVASADAPSVTLTQDSPAVRRALRQVEVELYETSWCQYCRKTRAFLDRSGISYRAYDIEADETAKLRRDRLAPGSGVPLTVVDGQTVRGFSEQALSAAFQGAVERRIAAR